MDREERYIRYAASMGFLKANGKKTDPRQGRAPGAGQRGTMETPGPQGNGAAAPTPVARVRTRVPSARSKALKATLEELRREFEAAGFASDTVDVYLCIARGFFRFLGRTSPKPPRAAEGYAKALSATARGKHPADVRGKDIADYHGHLLREGKRDPAHIRQVVNVLSHHCGFLLEDGWYLAPLHEPRRGPPTVLDEEETRALLRAPENPKHRCVLLLVYAAGLQLGELARIRLADLDTVRSRLMVRGKGDREDRVVPLSPEVVGQLTRYLAERAPKQYLFEGSGGGPYAHRSVQAIFQQAREKTGITKPVTAGSLRRAFAVHALARGAGRRHVRDILGHATLRTVSKYARLKDPPAGDRLGPDGVVNIP